MTTPLTARVLNAHLDAHQLSQTELSQRARIAGQVVHYHLSGKRPVRDDHLSSYLQALDSLDRPMLLAAWLRDILSAELISQLLDTTHPSRLAESIRAWTPQLDHEQRRMFDWWAAQLVRDPELDAIFRAITRKAGYNSM